MATAATSALRIYRVSRDQRLPALAYQAGLLGLRRRRTGEAARCVLRRGASARVAAGGADAARLRGDVMPGRASLARTRCETHQAPFLARSEQALCAGGEREQDRPAHDSASGELD